jgi:hypothetical protein
MKAKIALLAFLVTLPMISFAQDDRDKPSLPERMAELRKYPGYFGLFWDARDGRLFIEIPKKQRSFIYTVSVSGGLGSNDLGIDRGNIAATKLLTSKSVGPKLFLIQPNLSYRSRSGTRAEKRAVKESFAQSVIWGFPHAALESEDSLLFDATDFFLRDAIELIESLHSKNQGLYKIDLSRSSVLPDLTKSFPKNTEVEVLLTYVLKDKGKSPGSYVKEVTPAPKSISLRVHHSLVALPEPGYKPRVSDPRAGFFEMSYVDHSAAITSPNQRRFIYRHRLQKKNPEAAVSEPLKAIIYYVDRGVPADIRQALCEGASWWDQAFEVAGYKNAFQVKLLPKGADPWDIRYNVIQWVHRKTRGWSYGQWIADPRTGEIIKGHIVLGSLRARQDALIAQALLSPYGKNGAGAKPLRQLALARLRQLAAHEVGHTLGVRHNFAASINNRASVMDYPHPRVLIQWDKSFDLSQAYTRSIGRWDKFAIRYGYSEFSAADENIGLQAIIDERIKSGLLYLTDSDARSKGSAHPMAHLWDNGVDPIAELNHVLRVRRLALQRFGRDTLAARQPLTTLHELLVPLYLFHRYQTEAVAKLIGGRFYQYSNKNDNSGHAVSPARQKQALKAALTTLTMNELKIAPAIVALLTPRSPGYGSHRELLSGRTGVIFDPMTAAESAAQNTLSLILHPQRANRLILQKALDPKQLGLSEVLRELLKVTWIDAFDKGLTGEIRRSINILVINEIKRLRDHSQAASGVRTATASALKELKVWLVKEQGTTTGSSQKAYLEAVLSELAKAAPRRGKTLSLPPGSPIGCGQ